MADEAPGLSASRSAQPASSAEAAGSGTAGAQDVEVHHKRGPIHGWREFLKEVGIIVLGVLIALSAEQAVEWLHRHAEVTAAREALHDEISGNVARAEWGIEEDRCLATTLDQYASWTRGGGYPRRIQPGFPTLASSTWDVVKSGAASHMPLRERLGYAWFYHDVENQNLVIQNERAVTLRLAGAASEEKLDPAEARRVLDDVTQARILAHVRTGNGQDLIREAKRLGIEPKPLDRGARTYLARACGQGKQDAAPEA